MHRLLRLAGHEAVLLDNDMAAIETMRAMGHRVFLGDPRRPEVLESAGLARARVLVVALDNRDATTRLVAVARQRRPDLHIIARAQDRAHAHALTQAGANEVLREMFDSSLRAGRHALEALGFDEAEVADAERVVANHDRASMAELSTLWRPDIPLERNEPYLARARQLNDDLEASLAERLGKARKDAPSP